MSGKQIALIGLVAVGMFWLLRAQGGTRAAGTIIQDTGGNQHQLFLRPDGVVIDERGKVWI